MQRGRLNDNDDEDDDLLERFFKVEAWWNFQLDGSLSDRIRVYPWLTRSVNIFFASKHWMHPSFQANHSQSIRLCTQLFYFVSLFLVELVLVSTPGLTSICLSPGSQHGSCHENRGRAQSSRRLGCSASLWGNGCLQPLTRWWFQIVFIFTPTWRRFPFWRIFFQTGWNHQLVEIF